MTKAHRAIISSSLGVPPLAGLWEVKRCPRGIIAWMRVRSACGRLPNKSRPIRSLDDGFLGFASFLSGFFSAARIAVILARSAERFKTAPMGKGAIAAGVHGKCMTLYQGTKK